MGNQKKAWHIRDHSGITFIQRNGRGSGKIQQLDNGRGVGGHKNMMDNLLLLE